MNPIEKVYLNGRIHNMLREERWERIDPITKELSKSI